MGSNLVRVYRDVTPDKDLQIFTIPLCATMCLHSRLCAAWVPFKEKNDTKSPRVKNHQTRMMMGALSAKDQPGFYIVCLLRVRLH